MLKTSACVAACCWLVSGCAGDVLSVLGPNEDIAATEPGDDASGDGNTGGPVTSAQVTLRRLTLTQYRNSMTDLLHVTPDVSGLSEIPQLSGLRAIGASSVALPERDVEAFVALAERASAQVFADAEARDALVGCEASDATCARDFLLRFARRAFRRPLHEDERARYLALLSDARSVTGDGALALEAALTAVLSSPLFLYREETGVPSPSAHGERALTAYELAARLSFFLWNSTPDDALLDAAERGELDDEQGLRAQAERLLGSERAAQASEELFADYLRLDALDALVKLPELFPLARESLFVAMREETQRFLRTTLFERGDDLRTAFTGQHTFVNDEFAELYGLDAQGADDFYEVELPLDSSRAGILTHASFLASHAHPGASSPTRRGKFVRENLLCQAMPPPPDDVDTSLPEASEGAVTARERLTEHRENAACAGCHALMDPIGLALEHFDGLGAYREDEAGLPIDVSGELDGVSFDGAVGLSRALAEHPELTRCFVRTLLRYARGVLETASEQELVSGLDEAFVSEGRSMPALMLEIVTHPAFRQVGAL